MAEKHLLDACALIAYLNDEEGAEKVEELLWQSDQRSGSLLMHEVNLLEVYCGVYRDEDEKLAEETYEKAIYKVSLADSIALAEAKVRRIPLVTCDHHEFDHLYKMKELEFLWIR